MKGVSTTLKSGTYTLAYPWGRIIPYFIISQPANTICWSSIGLMRGQRRIQSANIKPELGEYFQTEGERIKECIIYYQTKTWL